MVIKVYLFYQVIIREYFKSLEDIALKKRLSLINYKLHEWVLLCLACVFALSAWWLYTAWLWGGISYLNPTDSNVMIGLGMLLLIWGIQSTLIGLAVYHFWRRTWDFSQLMLVLFASSLAVFFVFATGCVIVPWYGLPT